VAPTAIATVLLWTVLGGVIIGGGVAGATLLLAGHTEDHLVEITLTVIVADGSFLIAEHFHSSGVLASLTAGMVVGNIGRRRSISPAGRDYVLSFWEYAAFLANSTIFILILGPISGVALGLNEDNRPLIWLALFSLTRGIAWILGISFVIGFIHGDVPLTNKILSRTDPKLFDLAIALAGGVAGAVAVISSRVSKAIVGVAVAMALVPRWRPPESYWRAWSSLCRAAPCFSR
jgi:NhaP-type Na+/H+ or K+/H+ antiporter